MANAEQIGRYRPREYYKSTLITDGKNTNRELAEHKLQDKERELSKHLPKPNVVRIEVLPAYARQSFLGGYYGTGDKIKQDLMKASLEEKHYLPFYGIVDNSTSSSMRIGVKANWDSNPKQGFTHMMGMLSRVGTIAGSDKISGLASGLTSGAAFVEKQANQFMGIDNVSTGTSTIKSLRNVSLSADVPINVKWYMPEQSRLCRIGIERLLNLAYVRGLQGDVASKQAEAISGLCSDATKKGREIVKMADENAETFYKNSKENWDNDKTVMNGVQVGLAAGVNLAEAGAGTISTGLMNAADAVLTKDNLKSMLGMISQANQWFGNNMTLNPLPVRVSIGHVLNVEPMVITSVEITYSKEQYIADDGSHIPIWVTASIHLTPWMVPGPDKQFFSFLGDEIFDSGATKKQYNVLEPFEKGAEWAVNTASAVVGNSLDMLGAGASDVKNYATGAYDYVVNGEDTFPKSSKTKDAVVKAAGKLSESDTVKYATNRMKSYNV